jgi:hypothetical protein
MFKVSSLAEAKSRYGEIVNGHWADEAKWMKTLVCPSWFAIQTLNSATGKDTDHIYMNTDMHEPFLAAIQNLVNEGVEHELKTFDGCFMIRDVRGLPGAMSWHSLGLAIDLNAKSNPLGGPVTFSDKFIKCFTEGGFASGAHFHRKDAMHFSWGAEG